MSSIGTILTILRNGQGDDPGEAARDPALILGFKTSGIVEAANRQFYFLAIQTGDARPTGWAKEPLIALRAVPPNRIADQFDLLRPEDDKWEEGGSMGLLAGEAMTQPASLRRTIGDKADGAAGAAASTGRGRLRMHGGSMHFSCVGRSL